MRVSTQAPATRALAAPRSSRSVSIALFAGPGRLIFTAVFFPNASKNLSTRLSESSALFATVRTMLSGSAEMN
jgi:hypothetical protein